MNFSSISWGEKEIGGGSMTSLQHPLTPHIYCLWQQAPDSNWTAAVILNPIEKHSLCFSYTLKRYGNFCSNLVNLARSLPNQWWLSGFTFCIIRITIFDTKISTTIITFTSNCRMNVRSESYIITYFGCTSSKSWVILKGSLVAWNISISLPYKLTKL